MIPCAFCGMSVLGETGLCRHHTTDSGERWADVNRTMCDFFHRRQPPPRLPAIDRLEDRCSERDD